MKGVARSVGRSAAMGLLLVLVGAGTPGGQALSAEKLTLGVNQVSPSLMWVFLANDSGAFREQGLEVETLLFASARESMPALLGRRLSMLIGVGGPTVPNAILAGAELVLIGEFLGTMPYSLMVSPGIAQATDLKGKRLAIGALGSSADFATRFAVARLGLAATRDVTFIPIGDQSARLAALLATSVDGTLISAPSTIVARKQGFRELTSLVQLGLRYPHESLAVHREWLRERPDTLRRFMKAAAVGVHRFKTDREPSIQLLRKHLKIDDPEALAEAYDVFSKLVPAKPYLAPEAIKLVLDEIATTTNPRAQAAKPEDFIDMRFVKELDESGFIDRLYK